MKNKWMKQVWITVFFIFGLILFITFIGAVMPWSFHDDEMQFHRKKIIAGLFGLASLIGLPALALLLSARGILPGTHKKD